MKATTWGCRRVPSSRTIPKTSGGRTRGTGHIQRITFNEGRPIQREPILTELRQRIRDVRQGPDGLLYALTDEDNGALLKIEPAPAGGSR